MHRVLAAALVLGGLRAGCADDVSQYYAVCDAGSTGTRLYVFRLPGSAWSSSMEPTHAHEMVSQVFREKVEPDEAGRAALSAFADDPAAAVPPLLKLFSSAAEKLPGAMRRTTPTLIYGTGGMRALPQEQQDSIWAAVRDGLTRSAAFPFDTRSLELRTVNGSEEGLWAMYTANVLSNRTVDFLSLRGAPSEGPADANLFGILDLGGASTQVALPPPVARGMKDYAQSGLGTDVAPARRQSDGSSGSLPAKPIVESYLGFGANAMRRQLWNSTPSEMAACYQRGAEAIEGKDLAANSGNATNCRSLIRHALRDQIIACRVRTPPRPSPEDETHCPRVLPGRLPELLAVTGYFYAADFVKWWLDSDGLVARRAAPLVAGFVQSYPSPTLAELAAGVDALCSTEYSAVEAQLNATGHLYTPLELAQHRCYQANYALVFLGDVLGIPWASPSLTFAHDISGQALEWPLGAALDHRYRQQHKQQQQQQQQQGQLVPRRRERGQFTSPRAHGGLALVASPQASSVSRAMLATAAFGSVVIAARARRC